MEIFDDDEDEDFSTLLDLSKKLPPRRSVTVIMDEIMADEDCGRHHRGRRGANKKAKMMPAMQSTPHESDAPGWCSDPKHKLSAKAIAALDAGAGNDLLESDLLQYEPTRELIDRKGATDDRTLVQYFEEDIVDPHDEEGTISRIWLLENARTHMTKYGYAKFGKRLEAMHAAIQVIEPEANACPGFDSASHCDASDKVTVLLLGKQQPICRANCIPALTKVGIVIQRREE